MKKLRSFLFIFFLLIASKSIAQDFQITQLKVDFDNNNNQLKITYNIDSKNPADRFLISVIISRENGELIHLKSITGDIGNNIKSGDYKTIIWDMGKDALYFDENISVEVKAETIIETFNKSSLILASAVLPGLGQTKVTGKPWWLGGVVAYGALAGGVIYHKISLDTHDKYLLEKDDIATREKLYDKSEKEWLVSTGLLTTGAAIWAANMIWMAVIPSHYNTEKHVKVFLKPTIFPDKPGTMVSLRVDF